MLNKKSLFLMSCIEERWENLHQIIKETLYWKYSTKKVPIFGSALSFIMRVIEFTDSQSHSVELLMSRRKSATEERILILLFVFIMKYNHQKEVMRVTVFK